MSKVLVKQLKQSKLMHALYIKAHNYHWNVKVKFFLFMLIQKKIYNSISEFDNMVKRVLTLGKNHI